MPGLETMSWIAAIAAIPVAIIGWFLTGKQKTNRATASTAGIAIAGDVSGGTARIVIGHQSAVNLTVHQQGRQDAERYQARYAILQAVDAALKEVEREKMIATETFQAFSKAVTDSRFLLGHDNLVAYLNEVREHVAKFQACAIAMEPLPPGDQKAAAATVVGEERLWLMAQVDGLARRFEPVLRGLR